MIDADLGRRTPTAQRRPAVAIVIPVYKHSVLVIEALTCALAEIRESNGVIIVVNDGCPFPETHENCLTFAHAFPGVLEYIRTANGGLSAARNQGIAYAVARYPGVESLYLLDADNRLNPGAISRAILRMRSTGADWVYPSIDRFGLEWSGDVTGPYSVFRHLFQNICDAGSLIHRRIIDAGIRYDEQMRQGYEDWEFWLQCAEAGFRGVPFGDFGFQYRSRRESMVRNSDRSGAEILAYMHRKHKKLFSWKNILRLEHQDAPRFCIIDQAHQKYNLSSIAGESSRRGDLVDLDCLFWQAYNYPTHFHYPQFTIVADRRILDECVRHGLADWVLWQIEDLLEQATIVFVFFQHHKESISFSVQEGQGPMSGALDRPHVVASRLQCVTECALDPRSDWIDTLSTPAPEPKVCSLTISAPFSNALINNYGVRRALQTFLSLLGQFRHSTWKEHNDQKWEWRPDAITPSRELYLQTRAHMNAIGPIGRCAMSDEKEVAFLLPVASFGGVEQVAIQVAREFRLNGWRTRLVITQASEIKVPERLDDAFDCFCFLNDPPHAVWSEGGLKYYGHDLQRWATEGRLDRLNGLVAGCAAVFLFHAMHGNEAMGWLRRQGIVTATSLHVIDRDPFGAPAGHPYWMLAYEHAYDFITAPSQQLLDFCSSTGVPREKLLLLPNAPTFDLEESVRKRRLLQLKADDGGSSDRHSRALRILYIGRLDRQKGFERLVALIQATRDNSVPVEWRLVGSSVLPAESSVGLNELLDSRVTSEPAIYDRAAIVERLLWADVTVLLSHWEGSPLIILEAQRVGTIPIVTDVGAVSEMIDSGKDGVIIPNGSLHSIVGTALEKVVELQNTPSLRQSMSIHAMERVREQSWKASSAEIIERIDREVRKRMA